MQVKQNFGEKRVLHNLQDIVLHESCRSGFCMLNTCKPAGKPANEDLWVLKLVSSGFQWCVPTWTALIRLPLYMWQMATLLAAAASPGDASAMALNSVSAPVEEPEFTYTNFH